MRKVFSPVVGALALSAALAACSSGAAKHVVPTPTRSAATPVPQSLQGYASLADPTLRESVGEGTTLLNLVRSAKSANDLETLGNSCATYGGDFSDQNSSFRETEVPPGASRVYHDATQAYKVLLSSTDECGMAADSRDTKQLKGVVSDMSYAVWVLQRTEKSVAPWNRSQG